MEATVIESMSPGERGFGGAREDAIPKKRVKILGVSNKKTTEFCSTF